MPKYILKDTLATKQRGKPVYLNCICGIGPVYTEELSEAERFNSKQEAMQSPAYAHSLCFFEPEEIA